MSGDKLLYSSRYWMDWAVVGCSIGQAQDVAKQEYKMGQRHMWEAPNRIFRKFIFFLSFPSSSWSSRCILLSLPEVSCCISGTF